jgi:hypothetical protein
VKLFKLVWVMALPFFVLLMGLLLLQGAPPAVVADDQLTAQEDWPPRYESLSRSSDKSVYADMDTIVLNGKKVIVVVWTEAAGESRVSGSIKMKWRFEDGSWNVLPRTALPQAGEVDKYSYPALALHNSPDNSSVEAHVTWLRQSGDYMWVQYGLYALTESASDFGSLERISSDQATLKELTLTSPDITVDANGCPHVVWAALDPGQPESDPDRSRIYYSNKCGGSWGNNAEGWAIANGQKEDNPAIAVSGDGYIYAVWEDNGTSKPGIQVMRRTGTGGGEGSWTSQSTRVSDQPYDSLPSLAVDTVASGGMYRVFVAWQRQVGFSQGTPPSADYSISYKVLLGTNVTDDWWPGGNDLNQCQSVFTSTTYAPSLEQDEFYLGLRPSIEVIGHELHVAYQHGGRSGTGSLLPGTAEIGPSNEGLVKDFQVVYAHASHERIPPLKGVFYWTTKAITIEEILTCYESEPVFTNPSLSIIAGDEYPHVAFQKRVALPGRVGQTEYTWNVWYANDGDFDYRCGVNPDCPVVYLPMARRNY